MQELFLNIQSNDREDKIQLEKEKKRENIASEVASLMNSTLNQSSSDSHKEIMQNSLKDLGADSLSAVKISSLLQQKFKLTIEPSELLSSKVVVKDICEMIENHKKPNSNPLAFLESIKSELAAQDEGEAESLSTSSFSEIESENVTELLIESRKNSSMPRQIGQEESDSKEKEDEKIKFINSVIADLQKGKSIGMHIQEYLETNHAANTIELLTNWGIHFPLLKPASSVFSLINLNSLTAVKIQTQTGAALDNIPTSAVFLTGATGFLGCFLLSVLLEFLPENRKIYCLVRASDAEQGRNKLLKNLQFHKLLTEKFMFEFERKAIILPGDLTQSSFGLREEQWNELVETVEQIYHNGAQVNGVLPLDDLKAVNVFGTKEVIRLASAAKKNKQINFVSTISTCYTAADGFIYEDTGLMKLHHLKENNGYATSKWVAETLILQASQSKNIPCCIFRPGTISGDSVHGSCNSEAYIHRLISGIIQLRAYPDSNPIIELIPVDYVAKSIVLISSQSKSQGKSFNITNPSAWDQTNPLHINSLRYLATAIEKTLEIRLSCVPFDQWKTILFNQPSSNPLTALASYFLVGMPHSYPVIHNNTTDALAGHNLECPPQSELYVSKIIHFLQNIEKKGGLQGKKLHKK